MPAKYGVWRVGIPRIGIARRNPARDKVLTAKAIFYRVRATKGASRVAIYTIAQYQVRASGIDKVKRAIEEFVPHVQANEPGTRMYLAWQQKDDPSRFVHFFIFEDENAHAVHAASGAVKRFEAAYGPELADGPVVFTDYLLVAAKR
jgi:quinol monooxygenase YgiN